MNEKCRVWEEPVKVLVVVPWGTPRPLCWRVVTHWGWEQKVTLIKWGSCVLLPLLSLCFFPLGTRMSTVGLLFNPNLFSNKFSKALSWLRVYTSIIFLCISFHFFKPRSLTLSYLSFATTLKYFDLHLKDMETNAQRSFIQDHAVKCNPSLLILCMLACLPLWTSFRVVFISEETLSLGMRW